MKIATYRKAHPLLSALIGGSVGSVIGGELSGPHGAETFLGAVLGGVVGGMIAAPKGRRGAGAGLGFIAAMTVGLSVSSRTMPFGLSDRG